MATFLLFVLSTIGLTHIITHGKIFDYPRDWIAGQSQLSWISDMIECYQCCGFWCGLLLGALIFPFSIITILACGFASSFLAVWASIYLDYLDSVGLNDE